MKISDRIRAFLNDEPTQSDASGMFIEREGLTRLLEEINSAENSMHDLYDGKEEAFMEGHACLFFTF